MLLDLAGFIEQSLIYGRDPLFIQGAGGNTSIKAKDGLMLVKGSGTRLKDLSSTRGLASVQYERIKAFLAKQDHGGRLDQSIDDRLSEFVDECTISKDGIKASIETAMHAILGHVVMHTHPIELNAILCTVEAEDVLHDIFASTLDYAFVPYFPPGFYLSKAIYETAIKPRATNPPRVIFLQSHGLIVHGQTCQEVDDLSRKVFEGVRGYLADRNVRPVQFSLMTGESALQGVKDIFPDTVVFRKYLGGGLNSLSNDKQNDIREIYSAAALIYELSMKLGLQPRLLKDEDTDYIINMSREKYRQNLVNKS